MADKITKEEFYEWLQHPVTQEMWAFFAKEIDDQTWSLVETAGKSTYQDAQTSGRILAMGDLLNWRPETIVEEIGGITIVEDQEGEEDA